MRTLIKMMLAMTCSAALPAQAQASRSVVHFSDTDETGQVVVVEKTEKLRVFKLCGFSDGQVVENTCDSLSTVPVRKVNPRMLLKEKEKISLSGAVGGTMAGISGWLGSSLYIWNGRSLRDRMIVAVSTVGGAAVGYLIGKDLDDRDIGPAYGYVVIQKTVAHPLILMQESNEIQFEGTTGEYLNFLKEAASLANTLP